MDTMSKSVDRSAADILKPGNLYKEQASGSPTATAGLQAAASATEGLLSFNQDNLAAVIRSGQVLANGAQEMRRDMAAAAQSSLEDMREAMTAFASVRSLKDLMDTQARVMRATMDKAFTRGAQMAGNSFELTQQTLEPINARMTAAAKGLIPKA